MATPFRSRSRSFAWLALAQSNVCVLIGSYIDVLGRAALGRNALGRSSSRSCRARLNTHIIVWKRIGIECRGSGWGIGGKVGARHGRIPG